MSDNYLAVISFWFETLTTKDWWRKDEQLDELIRAKFSSLHSRVAQGEMENWRVFDEGRLAEIIVLDQFSRNMFRDQPGAFAYDQKALQLAYLAVESGILERFEERERQFILMPYMHSESLAVHEQALPLFTRYCSKSTLSFEKRHASIIERFGRYPHRNQVLGRESTPQEMEFLTRPGSSF